MVEQQRLLTIGEASRILAISRAQVYVLIRRGDLETICIGRARRVPVSAIDDFIAARLRDNAMLGDCSRSPPN